MKFNEIDRARWEDINPYVDTCLLPMTGLTGEEEPWKVTEMLERLRDTMEEIERRYVGRLVTYPAIHYSAGQDLMEQISRLCERLHRTGFRFVILITADPILGSLSFGGADLFLTATHVNNGKALDMVTDLWSRGQDVKDTASDIPNV